jgi:hypothetical protein
MCANVAFCRSDLGAETNEVLVSPVFQQLSALFLSADALSLQCQVV